MLQKSILLSFISLITTLVYAQPVFPTDPNKAQFVTRDIPNFWEAFDRFQKDTLQNPFQQYYLDKGSQGVKDFTENRIQSAAHLYQTVKKRKQDYQKVRANTLQMASKEKECRATFRKLKEWYPAVAFPPVYFVIGAFNSGGTSSPNGLIIGAEKQNDLNGLPTLVAHELVHFQQKFPTHETTVLEQSILEGSADFVAELVSGGNINQQVYTYGNAHKEELCKEFVLIMHRVEKTDWLYGVSGKDKRPNDLGYWMGYQITKAYFDKASNKKQAITDILNIKDYPDFLKKSAYLQKYL